MGVRSLIKSRTGDMVAMMVHAVSAALCRTNFASPWWFPTLMASLAAATFDSAARAMRPRHRRRRRAGIWQLLVRGRFLTWGPQRGFSWTAEYRARR